MIQILRRLTSYPRLTADSDVITKFMEIGRSDSSEGFGYLSMRKLPKIDKPMLAELQSLSSGRCGGVGPGNLRELKSDIPC